MADTKLKCLRVLDILKESDSNNPLTTAEISEKLAVFDLEAERKAINHDIAVLNKAGYDIRRCADHKKGYYMTNRRFEIWELKVLIDAIASAKFLTSSDSKAITAKLLGMASNDNARLLTQVTPANNQLKPDNQMVQSSLDYLLEAIRQKRQVQFQYQYTDPRGQKTLCKDGHLYVVNPYVLTWKDEHYYLIGNLDQHYNLGYYRLDRLINLAMIDQPIKAVTTVLGKNLDQHLHTCGATANGGDDGEKINLWLFCKYGLEDEIIDYFGSSIYHQNQADGFECHIRVIDSPGLIDWLRQRGNKVKVLGPETVRRELIASLEATLSQY